MEENIYDKTRRDFIKLASLGAFALHPTVSALARWLKIDKADLEKPFYNDEFHYFGNNLTNLHFYFINAKIEGKRLNKISDSKSFMIVKIPQQHISEQLLREKTKEDEGGFDPDYINSDKRTESKISGFSFLAFEIFPKETTITSKGKSIKKPIKPKSFIDLSKIEILLDWSNPALYQLQIPKKEDYKDFSEISWEQFRDSDLTCIDDNETNPSKDYICKLYKSICDEVFTKEKFPLTILEIPEGLLVTPYNQGETASPIVDTYRIPKTRFVYNGSNGKVVRTVEEIWSAQLFFDTAEGRISPPLRGVGYIPRDDKKPVRDKDECPKDPNGKIYLPTLLDKNEIVYLSSLGRGNNEGKEWNIETRGLTLTGLGAIAKFHYKNFNPPYGTDLAEYEHHFTLGRDEYIKVARIGVISVTGQKALHVKIGQRKIKNGISYMEFKEYIEIIQKEIIYFDKSLFLSGELNIKEPQNYIHARKFSPIYYTKDSDIPYTPKVDEIIHSIDSLTIEDDNTFRDKYIWNINGYLPNHPFADAEKNWHTKYSRWPFKKVKSVTFTTPPIDSDAPDAQKYSNPKCDCAELFWPVKEEKTEGKDNDCYLDFIGVDWNEKEVKFSSTFLFIRKKLIECDSDINTVLNRIYDYNGGNAKGFIHQKFERRSIRFLNQEIAFTPDYSLKGADAKEDLPNKSNVAKTDYLEYYFSICIEPTRKVKIDTNEIITIPTDKILAKGKSSIFNERLFPLFPQVKRAQLYVENIQGYASEPIPSIIEYNEDFVNYGFERKKLVNGVEVVYNKARLVFNHTEDFVKNSDGYKAIKQVFSGAGSAIGGLVNPDFDIQSIGLVKQSIALAKDFNKKYEQLTDFTRKIERFNPSDLLRQAPEIFNGISLIDILKEVIPESEAPINEIKNVASQIEQLNNDLLERLNDIKAVIETTKRDLSDLKTKVIENGNGIIGAGYETIQGLIDKKEIELKTLRDELNDKYQFSDVSNLIKAIEEYSKNIGLEFLITNPLELEKEEKAKSVVEELAKSIGTQILSKLELIQKLRIDINDNLEIFSYEFIKLKLKPQYDIFVDRYNLFVSLLLKDTSKPELGLKPFEDIIGRDLSKGFQKTIDTAKTDFVDYYKQQRILDDEKIKLVRGEIKEISQKVLTNFQNAKIKFEKPTSQIKSEIKVFKEKTDEIILNIEQNISTAPQDREKLKIELASIESKVRSIYEVILSVELSYIVESFETAKKEYEIVKAKICQIDEITKKPKISLKDLEDLISSRNKIEDALREQRDKLVSYFKSDDFRKISTIASGEINKIIDISKVIQEVNTEVTKYNIAYQDTINDIWSKIESIKSLRDKIKEIERELYTNVYDEVNGYKELLQKRIKQYENKLKEYLSQEASGVVGLLKQKIQDIENQIISEPDREDLRNLLVQSKQLYNTLTSLSRKEINYTWQTSSFKNADFGIVSFLASNNPKTSLSVNVKNTIHFQPNKFPAVVQKIESIAENRLNNFGISLLKAIIINFNEVSYVAGTNLKPKFEVKIRDVQFAGAFSFVQALESLFKKLLGDNFSVRIQPQKIDIEYLLPIPFIGAPSFGFRDILFRVLYTLHFTNKPMELGVGIGSPQNKTKLSVGIYTGFFHFLVVGNPKQGITTIEVSIEFGGYFGLSLGPLRGEVKLVVGLYYRKDQTGVVMEGYFLVEGRVKLWFIMITARFYMGVRSQGNYVEGRCTVTYQIKLGRFFKRSFTATYYKKLAGATPGNNQNSNSQRKIGNLALSTSTINYSLQNPTQRNVSPLTKSDWELFINSYID